VSVAMRATSPRVALALAKDFAKTSGVSSLTKKRLLHCNRRSHAGTSSRPSQRVEAALNTP
jgi:hypothetical protein